MNIAVIYYSKSGNTKKMADIIVDAINSVSETNARAFSIEEISLDSKEINPDVDDYINSCAGIIVGTPTYYASLSGAIKVWLERVSEKYNLSGKIGGAFATAYYVHGGADIAIQSVLSHLLCNGALAYSGGHSLGNPVIHLGPVALAEDLMSYKELFTQYGIRFANQVILSA